MLQSRGGHCRCRCLCDVIAIQQISSFLPFGFVRNGIDAANAATACPSQYWDGLKLIVGFVVGVVVGNLVGLSNGLDVGVGTVISSVRALAIVASRAHVITWMMDTIIYTMRLLW